MTGRDLIIYILANNLEDSPIYENGKIIGFMTATEAAEKFNVGLSTIKVWVNEGTLDGIRIGEELYIPANANLKGANNNE